jgi:hypothetical protein
MELMAQWLHCPQHVFPLWDNAWLIVRGEFHILAQIPRRVYMREKAPNNL